MNEDKPAGMNRREALTLVAITATGGMLMSQQSFAQAAGATAKDGSGLMSGAEVCVITPETTAGPYYFDPQLERRDITEGRPGAPTRVRLQVVDGSCRPIAGARVDLWHCDAVGQYSGYPRQGDDGEIDASGQTFMRGTQFADAEGLVEFQTVYPGWYPGRTTHMHFTVFIAASDVLTGQIFFPDELSQRIYETVAPYSDRRAERDTFNTDDGIALRARTAFAEVTQEAATYLAAMIIGVDPAA